MSMNENYELLIPTNDGMKDVKKISIDGVDVWKRAIPNIKNGTVPLAIESTRDKPLLDWSMIGNTVQDTTPTTDNPVEVKMTGDMTPNLATKVTFNEDRISMRVDKSRLKSDVTYAISFKTDVTISEVNVTIDYYNSNPFYVSAQAINEMFVPGMSYPKILFKFDDNIDYVQSIDISSYNGAIGNCTDVMLYKYTYPDPVYEPNGYRVPVVTMGKNLCPPFETFTAGYITNDDQIYKQDRFKQEFYTEYYIPIKFVEGSRVTFSFVEGFPVGSEQSDNYGWRAIALYDKDKNFIKRVGGITPDGFHLTEKLKEDVAFVRLSYRSWGRTENPQLELHLQTIPTPYEPYHPPITTNLYLPTPLASGEVLRSDGSRDVKWGKYEFTGDETFGLYGSGSGRRITSTILDNKAKPATIPLNTHFASSTNKGIVVKDGISSTEFWLVGFLGEDIAYNVNNFKEWLKSQYNAGIPLTVLYQLRSPTTEQIPNLPAIPTIKGTTILDVDTEVKPTDISATYLSMEGTKEHTTFKLGNGDILKTQDNRTFCVI